MERTITLICASLLLLLPAVVHSRPDTAEKKRRPIKVDDLFRFKRVSDPQVSPDGKQVAYVITTVDLAGNKASTVHRGGPNGGSSESRRATAAPYRTSRSFHESDGSASRSVAAAVQRWLHCPRT